jgi:hypothetical protein
MLWYIGNAVASILALIGLVFLLPAALFIYAGFTLFTKLEEYYA